MDIFCSCIHIVFITNYGGAYFLLLATVVMVPKKVARISFSEMSSGVPPVPPPLTSLVVRIATCLLKPAPP